MSKIAIVTGAGSGIGRAASLALAADGFQVVLAGRRIDKLDETAEGNVDRFRVVPCDVTNDQSVQQLFNKVRDEFGRIDLLFNNAGIFPAAKEMDEILTQEWKTAVDVNLTGAFLCTREAFALMKTQVPRGGRIINNGSISAYVPRPRSVAYTATKHAISGLTKSTALDGRQHDIACGQIDIGNAATDMTANMASGSMQASGTTAPEPRIDVNDVARAIVYMASLPLDANVLSMTVMATKMPYVGRG